MLTGIFSKLTYCIINDIIEKIENELEDNDEKNSNN